MNVGTLYIKFAEVNGTKPKSLRTGHGTPHRQQKSRARNTILTRLKKSFIGVLSDDFAAVDVREEYATLSLPKKQIRRVGKNNHSKRTIIPKKSRAKNNPNFRSSPRFGLFWYGAPSGTRTLGPLIKSFYKMKNRKGQNEGKE